MKTTRTLRAGRWTPATATLAILVACSGKPPNPGPSGHGGEAGGSMDCPDVPTQIFAPKCGTSGCHGPSDPAGGLDLASPGVAARVVEQPGFGCPGVLVRPAYPESSLLYKKLLATPTCGARMPVGAPPLTAEEMACVKRWITAQGGSGGTGGSGGIGGDVEIGGSGGTGGSGTCTDLIRNGVETDVDCGGLCPPCPVGRGCAGPTDCESFSCSKGLCSAASCDDTTQNGQETDVDCGGPTCPPCPGGRRCLGDPDCAGMSCQPNGICASSCTDGVKDGLEKGVDCGGLCPKGCPPATPCDVGSDCASKICAGGACSTPTCADMVTNGGESDIDCGGPCAPCPIGQSCATQADCAAGRCVGNTCERSLYISEVRTRGKNGNSFADEFVELYNPESVPITLDASWKVTSRNAIGGCQGSGFGEPLFVGAGQVVPPHGHVLIVGSGYAQAPAPDATVLNASVWGQIHDAGSITLVHHGQIADTLCYYNSTTSPATLTTCASPYACAGAPVSNILGSSGMDVSLERRPGGALGNGQNTDDSAADFVSVAPANPQSLASPPVP